MVQCFLKQWTYGLGTECSTIPSNNYQLQHVSFSPPPKGSRSIFFLVSSFLDLNISLGRLAVAFMIHLCWIWFYSSFVFWTFARKLSLFSLNFSTMPVSPCTTLSWHPALHLGYLTLCSGFSDSSPLYTHVFLHLLLIFSRNMPKLSCPVIIWVRWWLCSIVCSTRPTGPWSFYSSMQ